MTCIVGMEFEGAVVIGGDIQGTGPNNKIIHTQPKVFRKDGIIFGYTTSYRFGQIVEHVLSDPISPPTAQIYPWLVRVFVPALQAALKDSGYTGGGSALLGIGGELWELQEDFSVLRPACGYASVGSGFQYALGSLATYLGYGGKLSRGDVQRAISNAIHVAGVFSPSVGSEATFLWTGE